MVWRIVLSAFLVVLGRPQAVDAQIVRLPFADSTSGNFFGVSVSIDGDRALVGASAENSCGINSGAAYVFERVDTTERWHQVARLQAADCQEGDFFGRSLALSGDRALVAAAESFHYAASSNAAYIFERNPETGAWHQTARLTADPAMTEGAFATSVDLDGNRALITTSGDPSNGRYGGAAYIFEFNPRTRGWDRVARVTGSGPPTSGIFGGNGSLDGDRFAVAASTYFAEKPGSIYIFERHESGRWIETDRISPVSDFFIALDLEGDLLLAGESKGGRRGAGYATLYWRSARGWQVLQRLRPSVPYDHGAFGSSVSLSGHTALVVGYDEQLGNAFNIDRVVYVFSRRVDGDWEQTRVLDIGQIAFGASVDHDGTYALIGAATDAEPGAAYVAQLPSGPLR